MSYILDALKKSDQERQRHATPNLQSIQRPLSPRGSGFGWRNGLLSVTLLICCASLAALAWYFANSSMQA